MRDRRVRLAFLGLILAFPFLIVGVSPRGSGRPSGLASEALPLLAVEVLLVGGLAFAARERIHLLARAPSAHRPTPILRRHLAESRVARPVTKVV
jgi:hypothetical protein